MLYQLPLGILIVYTFILAIKEYSKRRLAVLKPNHTCSIGIAILSVISITSVLLLIALISFISNKTRNNIISYFMYGCITLVISVWFGFALKSLQNERRKRKHSGAHQQQHHEPVGYNHEAVVGANANNKNNDDDHQSLLAHNSGLEPEARRESKLEANAAHWVFSFFAAFLLLYGFYRLFFTAIMLVSYAAPLITFIALFPVMLIEIMYHIAEFVLFVVLSMFAAEHGSLAMVQAIANKITNV